MNERYGRTRAWQPPDESVPVPTEVSEALLAEIRGLRSDMRELIAVTRGGAGMRSDELDPGERRDLPPMMTIKEAAEALRTTPRALYMMIRRGTLPGAVRLGSRRLMVKTDEFLRSLHRMPTVD